MEIFRLNEKNAIQISLYYQQNRLLKRTLVGVRTQGKSKVKLRTICRDIAQHSAYDTEELYAMVRRVMNHAREEVVCGNVVEFDDYFTLRPEVHASTTNISRIEEFTSSHITSVGTQVKLNSSFANLTNEVAGVVVNVSRNDQLESVEHMRDSPMSMQTRVMVRVICPQTTTPPPTPQRVVLQTTMVVVPITMKKTPIQILT